MDPSENRFRIFNILNLSCEDSKNYVQWILVGMQTLDERDEHRKKGGGAQLRHQRLLELRRWLILAGRLVAAQIGC